MRLGKALIMVVGAVFLASVLARAQAPAPPKSAAPPKAAATAARAGAAPAYNPQVKANLQQLMRGTLYPASNVIFAAQDQNPGDVKPAKDPSVAVNPLESSYGQWQAVENSALALAEVANLLMLPRKCANGRDAPIRNADWPKFVQGLRDAGMTVYEAAKTKNQDKVVDAAGMMTEACSNCHDKYREKPNLAERCQ